MKFKLLKEFPGYPIGYIFESSTFPQFDVFNIKAYPDFFEEVKEPKTIYDLKFGDHYWTLSNRNNVSHDHCGMSQSFFETDVFCTFVTEREAKRNKLLRELATRPDKWLPKEGDKYYSFHLAGCDGWSWQGDNTDMIKYHSGLVFRNEEEYSRWMTEENKKLLFEI